MLSTWHGAPTTEAGPHLLPQEAHQSLDAIHSGLQELQVPSQVACHAVTSRVYNPSEVELLDVYGTGDCGFCAFLACAYPNEFTCPLKSK